MTGSSNGQLKVWSYNSGECLKTLDKGTEGHYIEMSSCMLGFDLLQRTGKRWPGQDLSLSISASINKEL